MNPLKMKYKNIIAIVVGLLLIFTILSLSAANKYVISTSTGPSIKLPILMYHQILKNAKSWGKYVISPEDFDNDIIYLKEQGYTTIVIQDLINFVYEKKALPDKPIMITFDDGYLSNYEYILPILEKHNCKAVISIVGEFTDRFTENKDSNIAYSHLTWEQVKSLVNSPYVEIQNHSYDMHKMDKRKGSSQIKGESKENYKQALHNDIGKMQKLMEEKTGYKPTAFTYPYGSISNDSDEILKEMGFSATLSCYSGVNILTGNKDELYDLKRYNRPSGVDRQKFFKQFDK